MEKGVSMNFRKMLALFLALLITMSAVVGCSKAQNENEQPATGGETEEKVVVKWWTLHRHDMEFMQEWVDKFNKENPYNIEVEYSVHSDNYQQALELATESNEAPDIFAPQQAIKYYVDRKMAEPLDQYITDEFFTFLGEDNFIEPRNMVDGKIYSLPNNGSVFRLIYNQDLFDRAGITKVPETMDEVIETAKIITDNYKSEGIYGFGLNLKSAFSGLFRSMDPVAQKSGINEYDYTTGRYDFSGYKPVILSFKEMFDNGSIFPGYESLNTDPMRAQFAQGNIAMYMSAEWEIGVYNKQFPTEVNWKAAPIPYIGSEPQGYVDIRGGYWQAIHANSKNKEAAFKVLKHLYESEMLKEYHESSLGFSLIPSVIETAEIPELKGSEYFVRSDYDGFWPAKPDTAGLKLEGKSYWDEILAVLMGEKDVDEAIDIINERYNRALDKAVDNNQAKRYIIEDFNASDLLD